MRTMIRSTIFLLFAFLVWQPVFTQTKAIVLTNPSFEGVPTDGTLFGVLPAGWYDCGFSGETVPDIHPQVGGGAFRVKKPPYHGNTYLGMVVRENDTWEMVTQRLAMAPLDGGKCYEFSMYLSKSELYVSPSRVDEQKVVNYTKPAKLRIWGGSEYCNRDELLAESDLINNTEWRKYNFRFEPKRTHTHLVFEAFYQTPTLMPYNGNILLDNCSAIVPVPCDEPPVVVGVTTPPATLGPGSATRNPHVINKLPKQPAKQKILKALDRRTLRKGQVIRIDQLFFHADSPELVDSSYLVLNEMRDFLKENSDVVIEIGGHTNSNPEDDYCDRLSTARAKAVVDYLVGKGIPQEQLTFKGYGKRRPIAPNNTVAGRKKNQRVEIKVLDFSS
ncbi:MAG: OmpA family protein [Saprospiraceae bacterium]|nr:MAG: OmpA family protein [Saprospiraceae bacterium]